MNTARFLKYVWPFYNIMHERVNINALRRWRHKHFQITYPGKNFPSPTPYLKCQLPHKLLSWSSDVINLVWLKDKLQSEYVLRLYWQRLWCDWWRICKLKGWNDDNNKNEKMRQKRTKTKAQMRMRMKMILHSLELLHPWWIFSLILRSRRTQNFSMHFKMCSRITKKVTFLNLTLKRGNRPFMKLKGPWKKR